MVEIWNSNFVEIHEKEKTIVVKGHFSAFVCGAISMLNWLAKDGVIKDVKEVEGNLGTDHQFMVLNFKYKKDFDKVAEMISFAIEHDSDGFPESEELIKEIKKSWKK